jgi:hypothetical protein
MADIELQLQDMNGKIGGGEPELRQQLYRLVLGSIVDDDDQEGQGKFAQRVFQLLQEGYNG